MVQRTSRKAAKMLELGATTLSIKALRALIEHLEADGEGLDSEAIDGAIEEVLDGVPGALEALARHLVPIYMSLSMRMHERGHQYAVDVIAEVTHEVLVPEFEAMPDELGDYLKTVFKAMAAAQSAMAETLSPEQYAEVLEQVKEARAAKSPYDALSEATEDPGALEMLHAMVRSTAVVSGYHNGRSCETLVPMAQQAAADMISSIELLESELGRRIDIYADDTPAERGQRALRIIEQMRGMWADGEWEEFDRAVVGE